MMDDTWTCEEWRALMPDALAGQLDEADRRRLERHLSACESCAEDMRTLGAVWEGLADLSDPEIRPDARAVLMDRAHGKEVELDRTVSGNRIVRLISRAAVVVFVFAGGLVAGRMWESSGDDSVISPESDGMRYLLLLHENESFVGPPASEAVTEYSDWAETVAADGRLAAAEKLTEDAGVWLTGPEGRRLETENEGAAGDAEPSAEAVAGRATGLFIIAAPSDSAAEQIAADMPHLKYGGTVQIRQIEEIDD